MSDSPQIDVQDIDHLGIIAGIVDELAIVEIIDDLLGTHEQEQVSAGQVVKGLILNCMGFLSAPLYLFSQFFEGKATEHLIGPGVSPEHLNDTRIGRVLDKLYRYGVTKVFVVIAVAVVKKFGIQLKSAHLDSTSLSVEGQYQEKKKPEKLGEKIAPRESLSQKQKESDNLSSLPGEEPIPVKITHGYSRDHRPDLQQWMVNLITSEDGGIPLFLELGNGNDVDKTTFVPVIQEFQRQWSLKEPEVIVGDSALYTLNNIQALGTTPWITLVPSTVGIAKELLEGLLPEQFISTGLDGYQFVELCSTYGNIAQRWIVFESKARRDAQSKKLEEDIAKAFQKNNQLLNALKIKDFACEADALDAAQAFGKTLKYHILSSIQTNLLEGEKWDQDEILRTYKKQQSCERGFRFIKDPLFFASSIFLKTPRRIMALTMIMALCLMVYSLGQRQLRQTLEQGQATLPNQKGQQTNQPTLRWILQCFLSVHLVWLDGVKHLIKLNDRQRLILPFLGSACQKYYFLC